MIHIDRVIEKCLTAIYSNDILNEELYLKGGQALRLAYNLRSRFSRDADFSTPSKIEEQDLFFNHLKESLESEFLSSEYTSNLPTAPRLPTQENHGRPLKGLL